MTHLNGSSGGKVYLLYNNSNGYNCAVTIKSVSVGAATDTGVKMIIGGTRYEQEGAFRYYAGPIRGPRQVRRTANRRTSRPGSHQATPPGFPKATAGG